MCPLLERVSGDGKGGSAGPQDNLASVTESGGARHRSGRKSLWSAKSAVGAHVPRRGCVFLSGRPRGGQVSGRRYIIISGALGVLFGLVPLLLCALLCARGRRVRSRCA